MNTDGSNEEPRTKNEERRLSTYFTDYTDGSERSGKTTAKVAKNAKAEAIFTTKTRRHKVLSLRH
jgi:hypothetical protein